MTNETALTTGLLDTLIADRDDWMDRDAQKAARIAMKDAQLRKREALIDDLMKALKQIEALHREEWFRAHDIAKAAIEKEANHD